jgi:hypothetical protein
MLEIEAADLRPTIRCDGNKRKKGHARACPNPSLTFDFHQAGGPMPPNNRQLTAVANYAPAPFEKLETA